MPRDADLDELRARLDDVLEKLDDLAQRVAELERRTAGAPPAPGETASSRRTRNTRPAAADPAIY